ncbi:MAG: lycopene cyclase domain-containing protein [Candidatus Acidiferrales bacterium]
MTEPIFVPAYWNPPSLFDLAYRTRFDIESLLFSFAIGGIGTVLYNALSATHPAALKWEDRREPPHRFHTIALLLAPAAFLPLALLSWNVIYAAVVALALGSIAFVACRPHLARMTLIGGALFLSLYATYMLGLRMFAPGYIAQVWNLPSLSGILILGIPVEEFLFGAAFGLYWSSVYEHFTWTQNVPHLSGSRTGVSEPQGPESGNMHSNRADRAPFADSGLALGVVSKRNATRVVKDGAPIVVDGSKGVAEL